MRIRLLCSHRMKNPHGANKAYYRGAIVRRSSCVCVCGGDDYCSICLARQGASFGEYYTSYLPESIDIVCENQERQMDARVEL